MGATSLTLPVVSNPAAAGDVVRAVPVVMLSPTGVDSTGAPVYGVGAGGQTYPLAASQTLASGASTAPVTGISQNGYVFAYQFGGTSPSLVLESLGPDGVNYQTVTTVTASGTQGVGLGNNSTVRLRNAGANAITGLSASLS